MEPETTLETLRLHMDELRQLGVERIAIFGSAARGEAASGSDVDVLVDFRDRIGLLHFVTVQRRLESILGRPVDLVTRDALHPALKDKILAEAIDAA